MVEVKTTNPANGYVMGHAQGMHAIMVLTSALWSDKTKMAKCKVDYNVQAGTVTIANAEYKYEFTNVPLLWDGSIDLYRVYVDYIQELRDKEVI